MNKIFHFIIEMIYWIAIFCSPLLLAGATALIIYVSSPDLKWLSLGVIGLGFITGVVFAEWARRKYGCAKFMSRMISTPDISPTDTYDKKDRKKNNSENEDI